MQYMIIPLCANYITNIYHMGELHIEKNIERLWKWNWIVKWEGFPPKYIHIHKDRFTE